jgi:hypothetical protein
MATTAPTEMVTRASMRAELVERDPAPDEKAWFYATLFLARPTNSGHPHSLPSPMLEML